MSPAPAYPPLNGRVNGWISVAMARTFGTTTVSPMVQDPPLVVSEPLFGAPAVVGQSGPGPCASAGPATARLPRIVTPAISRVDLRFISVSSHVFFIAGPEPR